MTLAAGTLVRHPQARIHYGRPAAEAVAAEVATCGASRVLVTTSRSVAAIPDGPAAAVAAALGTAHVGTFADIAAHSPGESVVAGAAMAREGGADLIVAVGGGSVIDASKAMLVALWEDARTVDDLFAAGLRYGRGSAVPPASAVRVTAVPNTFSAAEFTPNAGISNLQRKAKVAFSNPHLVPLAVVLDPAVTLPTPLPILLATGIKAVDHAVEAFQSPGANPLCDLYALGALRELSAALPAIKADPAALEPRQLAQFGMYHAILAATSGPGTGPCHAIGYALGAGRGIPHGETSALMLPAVMRWVEGAIGPRAGLLAAAFGDPARPAWEQLKALIEDLGLPARLADRGFTEADIDPLAEAAAAYAKISNTPRPIDGPKDIAEILRLAL